MVDFVQLREIIKERLVQDRTIHTVEAEGPTLEAAVSGAATLLSVPVRRLEYEVVEKGAPGFLGTGQKNWKIKAYERFAVLDVADEDEAVEEEAAEVEVQKNQDGDVFVHYMQDGVFLKVAPPLGAGKPVTEDQAMEALFSRQAKEIDNQLVSATVKEAGGVYIRVGGFDRTAANDAVASVEIVDQEMQAFVRVIPPGPDGGDISLETMLSILRNNRVVFGIDEDFLRDFTDRPVYKERVLVAEGLKAANGRDAYLQYNFDTDQSKVRLREGVNGKVDFKDLNIIQNVVEGQPLAKKISAEAGVPGRTVTGKLIPARDGKDNAMLMGKNVHLGDDGSTIVADLNGQVVVISGKINVEPVLVIQGNVDLKVGNILFLGTVVVNGNVEDGFSVKAAGNIEVNGTVEKAELDAEGDVIVHQGITGKTTGTVKAGRSVWARFIENAIVESGNMVVVSDGIINSQVDASKRIICQGKRAHIVGGRLRATEEINAKIIGSPTSGTETLCEVGFDPKSKERLAKFTEAQEAFEKELEEVQLNLQTLVNIRKQRKSLPEDKEVYMKELLGRRQELMVELQNIDAETGKIQEFLSTLKTRGKVSASSKVYPGVRIMIRDVREDVRTDYKSVTFILEDGLIRVIKYEEPDDEEAKKVPDGYTAN
jgi:uncharacterized protein (DUF342 family)